mgnify:CR=1 FL=1
MHLVLVSTGRGCLTYFLSSQHMSHFNNAFILFGSSSTSRCVNPISSALSNAKSASSLTLSKLSSCFFLIVFSFKYFFFLSPGLPEHRTKWIYYGSQEDLLYIWVVLRCSGKPGCILYLLSMHFTSALSSMRLAKYAASARAFSLMRA